MTEKRFTLDNAECDCIFIDDNHINKSYTIINDKIKEKDLLEVVDLLNEQYEENLELKHDNKRLVKFIMSKGYSLKDYLDWLKEEVWE